MSGFTSFVSGVNTFFQGETWGGISNTLNTVSSLYALNTQTKTVSAEVAAAKLEALAAREQGIAKGEDLLLQASFLDLEAQSIELGGLWEEVQIRDRLKRTVAANRASFAASGVQRSGSALAVLGRQFQTAGRDIQATRYTYGNAALASRMRGSLTRMRAASAATAGEAAATAGRAGAELARAKGNLQTANMLQRFGQRGYV